MPAALRTLTPGGIYLLEIIIFRPKNVVFLQTKTTFEYLQVPGTGRRHGHRAGGTPGAGRACQVSTGTYTFI
jgi:hypothetical protein